MFTAMVSTIMDWPDTTLPSRLAEGFEIVDQITDSHILRLLEAHRVITDPVNLLGVSAIKFVDELEADARVHPHGKDILATTTEELQLGLATGPFTRSHLDQERGRRNWRPLSRRMVYQDTKARPLDNGKWAGHNEAASMHETIMCTAAYHSHGTFAKSSNHAPCQQASLRSHLSQRRLW